MKKKETAEQSAAEAKAALDKMNAELDGARAILSDLEAKS